MLGAALKDCAAAMATTSWSTNGSNAFNIPGLRITIMPRNAISWTCPACAGVTAVSKLQKEDTQRNKTRELVNFTKLFNRFSLHCPVLPPESCLAASKRSVLFCVFHWLRFCVRLHTVWACVSCSHVAHSPLPEGISASWWTSSRLEHLSTDWPSDRLTPTGWGGGEGAMQQEPHGSVVGWYYFLFVHVLPLCVGPPRGRREEAHADMR